MAELFRYIQHAFVFPSATPPVDVGRQSDLQDGLRDAVSRTLPRDQVRTIADAFIAKHLDSPEDNPFQMRSHLLSFGQLLAPPLHGSDAIKRLIRTTFGGDAADVAGSDPFLADKALLDDILVCVKITTAFDRVNAHDLVAMRQAIAFIEDFAAGKVADTSVEGIPATLRRPIRIPSEFVNPVPTTVGNPPSPPPSPPPDESSGRHRDALLAEQRHLKQVYETIMSLPPARFELRPLRVPSDRRLERDPAGRDSGQDARGEGTHVGEFAISQPANFVLGIPEAAIEHLGSDVRRTLQDAKIDVSAPVAHVISAIKKRWQDVSRQLAPYQVPSPARVFRVGAHLFAVQDRVETTPPVTEKIR